MSIKTESESLFECFCQRQRVCWSRIPEGQEKSADYYIDVEQIRIVVEVKQLDMNDIDKRKQAELSEGNIVGSTSPAKRVKKQIESGCPQLKSSCEGRYPSMLVLYNNAGIMNHIDTFTISKAMYGNFAIGMKLYNGSFKAVSQKYRGGRKVTSNSLKSLSAIAVMSKSQNREQELVVYHNPFAQISLNPKLVKTFASQQYVHPTPDGSPIVQWAPNKILT